MIKNLGVINIPVKGQKSGYLIQCENCGKEVYQTKTQYNRASHHFCSNKCQKEFQHNECFEDRKCLICGSIFNVSKKSTKRLCSDKCQQLWQTKQIGELNSKFTREKIKCEICGKEYYVQKYKLKNNQHNFCSNICRQKWYSEIWSKTKEWKDISRKRATKILKNNPINTNTKPQLIVNKILSDNNIIFENEYNCKYFSIDNYLIKYNLMIEVMGDFWHSNPNKYQLDDLKNIQTARIPKDKAKHTYILNKYHIEILYLWENDINNNIDLCNKLINKYIDNNGILENYNSFNYHIENGELKLNNIITYPYYERCS